VSRVLILAAVLLAGCATPRDVKPIFERNEEMEVLHANIFDSWQSQGSMKGSVLLSFELKPGWRFQRAPTVQASAGNVMPGRFGGGFWEAAFNPVDARAQVATGVVTITVYWEAAGADGKSVAGRSILVLGIASNLQPTVQDFRSEER